MNAHQHHLLDRVLEGVPPDEAAWLRAVWDLAGNTEPVAAPDPDAVEQALAQVQARLSLPALTPLPPASRHDRVAHPPRQMRRWLPVWHRPIVGAGLAVAVVLLLAVGMFWWQQPLVQTAPPGERRTLTLPDGSRVELNSGAQLYYRRHFGAARTVRLDGEAFFDVTHAPRPFVVETFNARIEVLGTRFGVRAWPEEPEPVTTVALVSGRVSLAPEGDPAQAVLLQPGQTRQVARGIASLPAPSGLTVAEATAWRNGDLVFKDQPLQIILDEVERRFALTLGVQPGSLARQRLNLALRQPSDAEMVLRDLATALGLHYRETAGGYELYGE